jgi:hypothetical protein
MPEHEQQAMFPELERLRLERARLKLERERLKLEREQAKARKRTQHTGTASQTASRMKRPYRPQDPLLREYDTCLGRMREYESVVRQRVGAGGEVKPLAIYADAGGPSPKTQERVMARYGLEYPRNWPPSTWPAKPPITPDGQI